MTRFIHLSDPHISAPALGDKTLPADTAARLRLAVERIHAMTPLPDFVVISGDLIHARRGESYPFFKSLIAPLRVPVFLALGNHDSVAAFRAAFDGFPGGPEDPLDHDAVIGDVHLITLHTAWGGRVGGFIQPGQAEFLTRAVRRHPKLAKILVLHHPPMQNAAQAGDARDRSSLGAADTRRLYAALDGVRPAAILSGHIHRDKMMMWQGIPVICSTGLHSTTDPSPNAQGRVQISQGAGYGVCDLTPGGISAVYVPLHPGDLIREVPA